MEEMCDCPACSGESLAQMEAIAFYADVIANGTKDMAFFTEVLMADVAVYWTDADTEWLMLMIDLIGTRRAIAAMQPKPNRFSRFLRRWL